MGKKQLLIIGAGPYGLATAAYAKHRGLDFLLLGEPMGFWKHHMPKGMFLRTSIREHLDPLNIHTFNSFIEEKGITKKEANPIPVELFLDYAQWFRAEAGIQAELSFVSELRSIDGVFEARLDNGRSIFAENVLIAPGLRHFMNIPQDIISDIPANYYSHTCELVKFDSLKEKRCLIIGGRQSAFEWAALISEQSGTEIHISHRHDTPKFERSNWLWVNRMVRSTTDIRGWYRQLTLDERQAIWQRFWAAGRVKLEPWLGPRIEKSNIKLWPNSKVVSCKESSGGQILVKLDTCKSLNVDHVILATGYRVNVSNLPFLSKENLLPSLRVEDGFPVLDEDFQSSIPGLFFTSITSTRDFGPFFGFLFGCPAAAKIIIHKIEEEPNDRRP